MIIVAALAIASLILLFCARKAPMGYEDENGYHKGEPPKNHPQNTPQDGTR